MDYPAVVRECLSGIQCNALLLYGQFPTLSLLPRRTLNWYSFFRRRSLDSHLNRKPSLMISVAKSLLLEHLSSSNNTARASLSLPLINHSENSLMWSIVYIPEHRLRVQPSEGTILAHSMEILTVSLEEKSLTVGNIPVWFESFSIVYHPLSSTKTFAIPSSFTSVLLIDRPPYNGNKVKWFHEVIHVCVQNKSSDNPLDTSESKHATDVLWLDCGQVLFAGTLCGETSTNTFRIYRHSHALSDRWNIVPISSQYISHFNARESVNDLLDDEFSSIHLKSSFTFDETQGSFISSSSVQTVTIHFTPLIPGIYTQYFAVTSKRGILWNCDVCFSVRGMAFLTSFQNFRAQ